jgi:hypothetical protein
MKRVSNRNVRLGDFPRSVRLMMVIVPIVAICVVAMVGTYSKGDKRTTVMICVTGVVLSLMQFAWDKWKYRNNRDSRRQSGN